MTVDSAVDRQDCHDQEREEREDLMSVLEDRPKQRGAEVRGDDVARLTQLRDELRTVVQDLERTGRALVAGQRKGRGSNRSSGGLDAPVVLVGLLLTLHTVVVATITAVAVVGLLTGAPWRELIVRLVQ